MVKVGFEPHTYWVFGIDGLMDDLILPPEIDFINYLAPKADLTHPTPHFLRHKKASQKWGVGPERSALGTKTVHEINPRLHICFVT